MFYSNLQFNQHHYTSLQSNIQLVNIFTMSYFWPAALTALTFWDNFESYKRKKYVNAYTKYPLPKKSTYASSDVSVIIPTVDPSPKFTDNLNSVIENRPREIIIVTVPAWLDVVERLVGPARKNASELGLSITITTIAHPQKRDQLIEGINRSSGNILALVDDDALWKPTVLTSLLSPFEHQDVGLVGGPICSFVPQERQDPDIITPWEVAAVKLRSRRYDSTMAFFAADGGTNFVVSGATMLVRREIMTDTFFQHEFQSEAWLGVRQNTGDDSFITRWVLFNHLTTNSLQWKLGMQLTPDAEVATGILADSGFISQLKRWYRSGLRLRLQCLFFEPGFRAMYQTTPHMATKMAQGMVTPLIFWVRCLALYKISQLPQILGPMICGAYLLWHSWQYVNSLRAFYRQYPWAGGHLAHWVAIIIVDWLSTLGVSEAYSWFTLGVESWSTRI